MIAGRTDDKDFDLTFFDLFFQGLTDIAHSLYFGMDLPHEIQDVKAAMPGGSGLIGIGHAAFEFLDTYVSYLIARDLARVDFDAWRRMAERFGMVGTFHCALTARGEALVAYVNQLDARIGGNGGYYVVAQERGVMMDTTGIEQRVARIEDFKAALAETGPLR